MVPFRCFSCHFTDPFLSGITGLFLHVRCIPHQISQWLFWASVWFMLDSSRWHEPFGDVWIYIFNLVVHLSKVKQAFSFQLLTHRSRECWNSWPLWLASPFLRLTVCCIAWSRDNNFLFKRVLLSSTCTSCHMIRTGVRTCLRCGFPFLDGLWWGSIVHVIHLNTDSRLWGWREIEAFEPETRANLQDRVDVSFH